MTVALTKTMHRALGEIVTHIALHGFTPSVESLALGLGCNKSNAARLINCLIERGALRRVDGAGLAIGAGGTAIVLPPDIASRAADYCVTNNEDFAAFVRDAVVLHLDALEPAKSKTSAS